MSIKAYKIKKLDYETNYSFNCWHETELTEFLEIDTEKSIIEIEVDLLEEALKTLTLDEYTKKGLENDIQQAKLKDETYIMYFLF